MQTTYDSIFVIGPTASGKTALAVRIADALEGEIISADSRQVYRKMDLGTGKDLHEFTYHLIDICDAGDNYNIERFYLDAGAAIASVKSRNKLPVICGGSGLYIETLLKGNEFASIPKNKILREQLVTKEKEELFRLFESIPVDLRSRLDNLSVKKTIRAIEIAEYVAEYGMPERRNLGLKPLILATEVDRETRRNRISKRLRARFQEGMIEEVEGLLRDGVTPEQLKFYGLEYFWITQYVTGEIEYTTMENSLETAIHQFAKRQMTWFRRMEKQGYTLQWVPSDISIDSVMQLLGN